MNEHMPATSRRANVGAARLGVDRLDLFALALIALLSLAVDVLFARGRYLGYDEALHVFVSTLQPLTQFFAELKMEAHPPLHYLVLRVVSPKGSALLWPRLASIIPGIATVVFVFFCARELRVARPIATRATLAFALAPANVNMAICVRAYGLATMFTMLAYLYYLKIVRDPAPATGAGSGFGRL